MNYCNRCGTEVEVRVPEGDNRPRHCCPNCGAVHYQNPKIIAGCIPEWEDRILLCRRAIHPRLGFWTLPAGYMENGESVEQAAQRETWEEAQARVEIDQLVALYSVPHIAQVYTLFRGKLIDLNFAPGSESLEVDLFTEAQIPWNELAFPVIGQTLKGYFEDRKRLQTGTLKPMRPRS